MNLPHPLEALPVDGEPLDVLGPLMRVAARYQSGQMDGAELEEAKREVFLYVLRMRDAGFGERIAK